MAILYRTVEGLEASVPLEDLAGGQRRSAHGVRHAVLARVLERGDVDDGEQVHEGDERLVEVPGEIEEAVVGHPNAPRSPCRRSWRTPRSRAASPPGPRRRRPRR